MTTKFLLRPSSVLGEYYLGDKPGTLQYDMEQSSILSAVSAHDKQNDLWTQKYSHEFSYEDINTDTQELCRIMPNTPTAKKGDWEIILLREYRCKNSETIWLKGALKNRKNGNIALMTSTNRKELLKRPIKTLANEWFVGHYRMSATINFWGELANRIGK